MKTVALNLAATPDLYEASGLQILGKEEVAPRATISVLSLVAALTAEAELPLCLVLTKDGLISFVANDETIGDSLIDAFDAGFAGKVLEMNAVASVGSTRSRLLSFPDSVITPPAKYSGDDHEDFLLGLSFQNPSWTAGALMERIDFLCRFTEREGYIALLDQISGRVKVYSSVIDPFSNIISSLSDSAAAADWTLQHVFDLVDLEDAPETPDSSAPVWG